MCLNMKLKQLHFYMIYDLNPTLLWVKLTCFKWTLIKDKITLFQVYKCQFLNQNTQSNLAWTLTLENISTQRAPSTRILPHHAQNWCQKSVYRTVHAQITLWSILIAFCLHFSHQHFRCSGTVSCSADLACWYRKHISLLRESDWSEPDVFWAAKDWQVKLNSLAVCCLFGLVGWQVNICLYKVTEDNISHEKE